MSGRAVGGSTRNKMDSGQLCSLTSSERSFAHCPFRDGLRVVKERRHKKFVGRIEHVSCSGPFAAKEGRTSIFVTEPAIFRREHGGLELIEIAPGIDLEKDILQHMGFRPKIALDLRRMEKWLFAQTPMNLRMISWRKLGPA